MATISNKLGKWYVQIGRSFGKPINKSFIGIYYKNKRDRIPAWQKD